MDHQDFLLTFAEVAAAFAGFSAVVSSFVQRRESGTLRINHYRTRVMIEYGLCVVVFAFTPYLIFVLLRSEELAWRLSSVLLALTWALVAVLAGRRVKRILGTSGYKIAPGFSYLMTGLTVLGTAMLTLNAIGLRVGTVDGSYLIGLFFPLLMSALYFLHIVTHAEPDSASA